MADPGLIASQFATAAESLGPFVPAILFVLAENQQAPMDEVLDWERRLREAGGDHALRLVYADWLRERGCLARESQVRCEAESLRLTAGTCAGWNLTARRINQTESQPSAVLGVRLSLQWDYSCPRPTVTAPESASNE